MNESAPVRGIVEAVSPKAKVGTKHPVSWVGSLPPPVGQERVKSSVHQISSACGCWLQHHLSSCANRPGRQGQNVRHSLSRKASQSWRATPSRVEISKPSISCDVHSSAPRSCCPCQRSGRHARGLLGPIQPDQIEGFGISQSLVALEVTPIETVEKVPKLVGVWPVLVG